MLRVVGFCVVFGFVAALGGCGAAGPQGLADDLLQRQAHAPTRTQSDRILALVAITQVTGRKPPIFGN